jgi:hypothetical protein
MAIPRTPAATAAPLDFGPTLPTLLRRRFGVRERVTVATAVALLALAAAALLYSLLTGPEKLTYRAGPTFNIQYSGDVLKRVAPFDGELVRLEAHRGSLDASITVTRLHLPPFPGNVTSGLLPVYEGSYVRHLRQTLPAFQQRDEGSARLTDAQGYQVGFRAGPVGRHTWGRDILLVPRDEDVQEGVVLHFRYTTAGPPSKREASALDQVRKAFRSFNFGTDAAKW